MTTLESIQARIAKLQAQAETLVATKSTAVLEKIRGLMEKHDISLADLEAHVGKRRGRKSGAKSMVGKSTTVAMYADPKSGATWSGRGRAPSWIAGAKDRSKFLVDGSKQKAARAEHKAVKAGNYVRGVQAPKYKDPKTGATWSGRGRAPAWLASVRDRSKFLIAEAAESAAAPNATAVKAVTAKRAVAKNATVSKKGLAKKAAAKTVAAQARNPASNDGATAKAPVARKARVPRSTTKAARPVDAAVNQATTGVASTPAAA
ncbi:H-NS family nucleoid-associated regulatory protein [Paraburkholderia tagetis]|uniref:H-NS histone family protein n=1 Tax=Paraburkholderia tagetis TaxID=2913261 RepID=A0A9X1UJA8_9BURK|nr:H-NS family nucleoid-associated regulatory protein [Paraburkholderia tagetis]MCG5076252.1 H-NS histone family protein [Paraburkholderia tagetis]